MGYPVLEKKIVVLQILMLLVSQTVNSQLASPSRPSHIFLSFRGEDTRETFASLIYDALIREGFNVFMDDESIRTGQDIDLIIREAINNSMGSVIIFSKDFASSEWCLDELIGILGRKKELGSDYVLAVVYVDGIQPDDILDKSGGYGEALAKQKNKCWFWDSYCKKKVEEWRAALKQVTGYRGWILSGKWANFINEVVKVIRQECSILGLGITVNPLPPYPTGMDEFIKKLAIVGNFVYRNWPLLGVVMLSLLVQQQPHDQFRQQLVSHLLLLLNEG